uniref:Uncharacterized protein n=1 Tax=Glossina austeni TaxID=7395 RepID=A0A1A9UE99_GLOAU
MLTDMTPTAGQLYGSQIPTMGMNITNIATHLQKPAVNPLLENIADIVSGFWSHRYLSASSTICSISSFDKRRLSLVIVILFSSWVEYSKAVAFKIPLLSISKFYFLLAVNADAFLTGGVFSLHVLELNNLGVDPLLFSFLRLLHFENSFYRWLMDSGREWIKVFLSFFLLTNATFMRVILLSFQFEFEYFCEPFTQDFLSSF